jgi:hypothetical protein
VADDRRRRDAVDREKRHRIAGREHAPVEVGQLALRVGMDSPALPVEDHERVVEPPPRKKRRSHEDIRRVVAGQLADRRERVPDLAGAERGEVVRVSRRRAFREEDGVGPAPRRLGERGADLPEVSSQGRSEGHLDGGDAEALHFLSICSLETTRPRRRSG